MQLTKRNYIRIIDLPGFQIFISAHFGSVITKINFALKFKWLTHQVAVQLLSASVQIDQDGWSHLLAALFGPEKFISRYQIMVCA